MEISKNDWALFKTKLSYWQENYIERLINEYIVLLSDNNKYPSERFHQLKMRIMKDGNNPGVGLRLTRSEMLNNLAMLISTGAITFDDLNDFSDDLKQSVEKYLISL